MFVLRIALTIAVASVLYITDTALVMLSHWIADNNAADQFRPSDSAYWRAFYSIRALNILWIGTNGAGVILAALIWYGPVKLIIAWLRRAPYAVLIVGLCMLCPAKSWAYYDQTNWPEVVLILPNESAFFIPDTGDNKGTQGAFGSEQYFRDNKIATKAQPQQKDKHP